MSEKIRTLKEAKAIQDELAKQINHIHGILKYWHEFVGRGESPTHDTFFETEKQNLALYLSKAVSLLTGEEVVNTIFITQKLLNKEAELLGLKSFEKHWKALEK